MNDQLPEWLEMAFANHDYTSLPMDFCHVLFTKAEYTIEGFKLVSATGIVTYRMLATVDGDTYISLNHGFVRDAAQVDGFIAAIEPRLENLLACQ